MLEERRLNLEVVDASIKIKINEICLDHLNMDESKFIINRIETGNIPKIQEITPLTKEIFFGHYDLCSLITQNIKKTITENSILFDININSKRMVNASLLVCIEKIKVSPLINTTKMIEIKIHEINY